MAARISRFSKHCSRIQASNVKLTRSITETHNISGSNTSAIEEKEYNSANKFTKMILPPIKKLTQNHILHAMRNSTCIRKKYVQQFPWNNFCIRCYSTSPLYVPTQSGELSATVRVDLNIKEIIDDVEKVRANISRRKMDAGLLSDKLVEDCKHYCSLKSEVENLRRQIEDLYHQKYMLKKKLKKNNHNESDVLSQINELGLKRSEIKKLLRPLMSEFAPLEEKVILSILKLPNHLDLRVPSEEFHILKDNNLPKKTKISDEDEEFQNHLDIALDNGSLMIRPFTPANYYSNDFARLELLLTDYFFDKLCGAELEPYSCPEILKSVVVEGCGVDIHDQEAVFTIEDHECTKPKKKKIQHVDKNQANESGKEAEEEEKRINYENVYHLTGVSPMSFAAYFTKTYILRSSLPVKAFTMGRNYHPAYSNIDLHEGMFHLNQSQGTRVELFGLTGSYEESRELGETYADLLWRLHEGLAVPKRLVEIPAPHLKSQECYRIALQCWAPSLDKYMEVANVSLYSDYICRRLMIKAAERYDGKAEKAFGHTVHGCALYVPALMACILENGDLKNGRIDRDFMNSMWVDLINRERHET